MLEKKLVDNEIEDGLMEYYLYPPEDILPSRLSTSQTKELLLSNAKTLMENYRLVDKYELIGEGKLDESTGATLTSNKKERCLYCSSTKIKSIGSAFDGINANFQYRCNTCNKEWESRGDNYET